MKGVVRLADRAGEARNSRECFACARQSVSVLARHVGQREARGGKIRN